MNEYSLKLVCSSFKTGDEITSKGGYVMSARVLFIAAAVVVLAGSPAFAGALVKAMEGWHVTGMESACEFPFSFRIKIVGSDDPTFPEKAIFTGFISDIKGRPVGNARISLARVSGDDPAMPDGRSNREGIFVRTLIPPGSWNVRISCPGYADFVLDEMDFRAGEHRTIKAVLEVLPES